MTARTAACVKACEGISTEALTTYGAHDLPDFALIDALLSECKRLTEVAAFHKVSANRLHDDVRAEMAKVASQREQIQALREALGVAAGALDAGLNCGRRVQGTPVVECPRCKARWPRPVAKAAK